MNTLAATSNGDLQVFSDGKDVEISEAEKLRLVRLQSESTNTDYAIDVLKTAIKKAEMELQKDEKFQKLITMKGKLTMARKKKRELQSVIDYEYKNIFKSQAVNESEILKGVMEYIPDAPKKTGKRGRPRKELV